MHRDWLADTAAMAHIAMQDVAMVKIQPVSNGVVVGDRTRVACTKSGDVMLLMVKILSH